MHMPSSYTEVDAPTSRCFVKHMGFIGTINEYVLHYVWNYMQVQSKKPGCCFDFLNSLELSLYLWHYLLTTATTTTTIIITTTTITAYMQD